MKILTFSLFNTEKSSAKSRGLCLQSDQPSDTMVGIFLRKIERGMPVDEKEVFEICNQVDSFIAEYLTESIVIGTSYDMLEAHHGILPISRNCFYRRRRIVQRIMKQRLGRIEEEKDGQLRMVWGKTFECF